MRKKQKVKNGKLFRYAKRTDLLNTQGQTSEKSEKNYYGFIYLRNIF